MTFKLYDKNAKQEFEVMEYKYPASKEFKEFVGIKSYSESYTSKTTEDKTTTDSEISFTFKGSDSKVTMKDGYYFAKNEKGWQILTTEGLKEMLTATPKVDDSKKEEVKDKDDFDYKGFSDTLTDIIVYNQINCLDTCVELMKIIKSNLITYAESCLIPEKEEVYEDAKSNWNELFETIGNLYLDNEDSEDEDDDSPVDDGCYDCEKCDIKDDCEYAKSKK